MMLKENHWCLAVVENFYINFSEDVINKNISQFSNNNLKLNYELAKIKIISVDSTVQNMKDIKNLIIDRLER
jgi:hypothetical protein